MESTTIQLSPVNMEARKKLGIRVGSNVRVHLKIEEKGKTRIQVFEGLVLARKHGLEPGATFTVRKVASGVGVEKIFPLYSPTIDKIEVTKKAKTRRAKLYFIRDKVMREVRRKMRNSLQVKESTEVFEKEDEEKAKAAEEELKKAEEAKEAAAKVEEEVKAEESTEEKTEAETAPEEKEETTTEKEAQTEEEIKEAEEPKDEEEKEKNKK